MKLIYVGELPSVTVATVSGDVHAEKGNVIEVPETVGTGLLTRVDWKSAETTAEKKAK